MCHWSSLSGPAELDDETASEDQSEAGPRRKRYSFVECEPAKHNAGESEEPHINAEQFGEVPPDRIHQDSVCSERGAAQPDYRAAVAADPAANDGVAPHFKQGRHGENKPRDW